MIFEKHTTKTNQIKTKEIKTKEIMSKNPFPAAMLGLGLLCFVPLLGGCGGSSNSFSSSGNNGNMTATNTTTTTGSGGEFPPTVPPGTPLANVALPPGSWGGFLLVDASPLPATIVVSRRSSIVTLSCGNTITITEPIKLDANGSFAVQGTLLSSLHPATAPRSFTVTGQVAVDTVNGKRITTMFLGLDGPMGQGINGTYDVTLGVAALPSSETCP